LSREESTPDSLLMFDPGDENRPFGGVFTPDSVADMIV
jgi:hypothetical protein